ncbi:MAG TPA: GvpL/GvpF family gas vesicle protein [Candidatus Limnocylindria bacterium]|nr:GvpL/GvpF family gas vesicle protein [Candidatus Limnocylindria bacterium]
MTRYLAHAITRRATGGPETGLRGQPLEQITAGELGLWATRWDAPPALSRDDAFAHHDLVAVLCDAGACLPVRFGTWLDGEDSARRSLEADQERFASAVDRLGDRREVAVTLLWPDASLVRPGPASPAQAEPRSTDAPGRAFLGRRRALHAVTDNRRTEADAFAERLRTELAIDQADVRQESCPSAEVALSMSLLARRDEADALKARATAAVAALGEVRGVVSGPWPPYSFTEDLRGR